MAAFIFADFLLLRAMSSSGDGLAEPSMAMLAIS
jgi:hypothetical protein